MTSRDTTPSAAPTFEPVTLTDLVLAGVLMAANERFFWPLGLALTWNEHPGAGADATFYAGLHIREWVFPDGHHESIVLEAGDEEAAERRTAFALWLRSRVESMPEEERRAALVVGEVVI